MFSDYHVHSSFSFDSDETMENIITSAISLGMKQICITDHQDFNLPVAGETPLINIEEYLSSISKLQSKYKDQIQILSGIELGLMNGNEQLCSALLSRHNFDFVIGSCHVVDNRDAYYPAFWAKRTDREAFELYFNTLLHALKNFHNIDALGHLDYIVRYSPNKAANYSAHDYQDIIDEILKFIINNDIKLEINTSNFANGFDFPNPHTDIIKRYKELGGTYVTIGSDAHNARDIGYCFEKAETIVGKYSLKIFTILPTP